MMKTNQQLKATARENLLGHYRQPVCLYLMFQVITLLLYFPFRNMIQTALEGDSFSPFLITGIAGLVIVTALSELFNVSVVYLQMRIRRHESCTSSDLAYPFKHHPDKYMGYGVLLLIINVVCFLPGSLVLTFRSAFFTSTPDLISILLSALLYAVGLVILVILMLGWSVTEFLLLEKPYDLTVFQAMKESRRLLKGQKGRLFKLYLSFIGWGLLGLASLGLGLMWVKAYLTQTLLFFYKELTPDSFSGKGADAGQPAGND